MMKILIVLAIISYGLVGNTAESIKYSFNSPATAKVINEAGRLNNGVPHNIYKSNYLSGVKGTMLRLLGEGDYISTSLQNATSFNTSTLEMYFRADILNKPPSTIFTFYAADEKYIGLQIINGYLNLIDKANSKDRKVWQVGPKIQQGLWYHITFSIADGRWKLYLDGKLICDKRRQTTIKSLNPKNMYLGADYHTAVSAVRRLAGAIDEFKLTNTVRQPLTNINYKNLPKPKPFLRAWKMLAKDTTTPTVKIDIENAKIIINGKSFAPIIYHGAGFLKYDYFLETVKKITKQADYKIFNCPLGGRDDFSTGSWWVGENKYDFSKVERRLESFFLSNSRAWTILTVGLSPPCWWEKLHPNDIAVNEKNQKAKYGYYNAAHSFSSRKWIEDAKKALTALVKYIESTPYNSRIIGYQLKAGKYGEWIRWEHNTFLKYLGDYSKVEQAGFRKWLKDNYKNKSLLQKSWGNPNIDFENACIPKAVKRRKKGSSYFVNPITERDVVDYRFYENDSSQMMLIELANHARKLLGKQKIIGAYYYYSLANMGTRVSFGTEAGNLFGNKLMLCKSIDFLSTPYHYDLRRIGDCSPSMGAVGSLRAFGKLWLDEADIRTSLGKQGGSFNKAKNMDENLAVLWRAFGCSLTQGSGLWWFPIMGADCYGSPEIMQAFGKMKKEMDRAKVTYSKENHKQAIAVIANAYSYCFRRYISEDALTGNLITKVRRDFAKAGVDADFYMIDDIEKMPNDYKVYVFLNSFYLSDKKRDIIKKRFKINNNLLVWAYAAGYFKNKEYFSPITTSVKNAEDLTGMQVAVTNTPMMLAAKITFSEIKQLEPLGLKKEYSPAFWITDKNVTKIANYYKDKQKVAVAFKKLSSWSSLYVTVPELSPLLIRWFANKGGAHVYSKNIPSAIFYTSSNYVMIHTAKAGFYTVLLPTKCRRVIDVISGKVYGENCHRVRIKIPKFRTVLLRLEH